MIRTEYNTLIDKGYKEIADDILKERNLENNFGAVYTPKGTKINDYELSAGVLTPIKIKKKIIGGIYRSISKKQYIKVLSKSYIKYPLIYNIDDALEDRSFIIVTEGHYDCEAIKQSLQIPNCVATLTAAVKKEICVALGLFDKIYTAFDNDAAGKKAFDNIYSFFKEYYPQIEVEILEFDNTVKDVNEYIIKYGKDSLAKTLIQQMI